MKPSDLKKINEHLDESKGHIDSFSFLAEETDDGGEDGEWAMPSDDDWEEEGTPMDDMGQEYALDASLDSDNEPGDVIDSKLEDLVDMLIANDYVEESAEEAVYDACAQLIDQGALSDTPDNDASDEEKNLWLMNAVPKILSRLGEMGLEFDEALR